MEPNNNDRKDNYITPDRAGRVWGGLVLVIIGSVLLSHQLGYGIPEWLFSWELVVIAISTYVGARRNFVPGVWLVGICIGGVFLLSDLYPELNVQPYFWPALIIAIGLFMIFRPKRKGAGTWTGELTSDEAIDVVSVFGGSKKNILTKSFKGGHSVTVLGGTEIDLTQADFTGTAKIEMTTVFGGTKLRVPANWRIKSDVISVFGGVDDKRPQAADVDNSKILVLEGVCIFGGVELKSI